VAAVPVGGGGEPVGDGGQQLVAGVVAVGVVDLLELVEVEQGDDRACIRTGRPRSCPARPDTTRPRVAAQGLVPRGRLAGSPAAGFLPVDLSRPHHGDRRAAIEHVVRGGDLNRPKGQHGVSVSVIGALDAETRPNGSVE
jgi:hypothetical protein